MKAFWVLCIICLIAIIAVLIISAITVTDYLRTIKTQVFIILDEIRSIDRNNDLLLKPITEIQDNMAYIKDTIYDEENEESAKEDKPPRYYDGWALAPCPVCGTPARMAYDHDTNGGFYVICSKHSRNDGCDYGIVAGGPTRMIAAKMWNETAVKYTMRIHCMEKEDQDANTSSN